MAALVSGKQKCAQAIPTARNTAKKIYVPQAQASNIGGTKHAIAILFNQLLEAPIEAPLEAPLARIDKGKISATIVQHAGPQVSAKCPYIDPE